jgi:hypothetical protein
MAIAVAACGDDDGGNGLEIGDPWARTSAAVQNAGAAYMTISAGDVADVLVGVTVDSSVAGMAELHQSTMGDDGMMVMSPVESIAVPANGSVSLEPGGYHVMLMNLAAPLEAGAEFELTLEFETVGEMTVTVEVREG